MQTIAMNDDAVRIGIGYSLLSAVTYGLNPVFAKFGYASGLDGIEILHARFLFALLVLAVACPLIERGFYKFPTSVLKGAILIALLVLVPLNLLYVFALKDIPASMMSLITYIYPLIVLVLNVLIFRRKATSRQIFSIALILVGCACIFSDAFTAQISGFSLCLGFLSTVMYAVYLLSLQAVSARASMLQLTFLTVLIATAALSLVHNPLAVLEFTTDQLGVTFAYGLISTALSTFFLSKAIQTIGATEAGIFCSFEPIFTISFAALLLAEHIPFFRAAGMVFLVFGIVVPNLKIFLQSINKQIRG